ncbi:MAG: glycosyltransferase family 4 protein [Opitutales bacterium]|nr:glycosyltransferase family 4 protein [Opitutales bacterium]
MKIAYLFTTFPKYSETFLAREVEALAQTGEVNLTLFSFLGGRGDAFAGCPLHHLRASDWMRAAGVGLFLCLRRPSLILRWMAQLLRHPPRSFTNLGEQCLGTAFALSYWARIARLAPDRLHATWATGPATAALLLRDLTGIPFSMAAHAYDIHRHGGDCWLRTKLEAAAFIHTSSDSAAASLRRRSPKVLNLHVVRRGLEEIPPFEPHRPLHQPIHLLSVGRLVPKKGWLHQMAIYRAAAEAGLEFHARIVGRGPQLSAIEAYLRKHRLSKRVELVGQLPYADVLPLYKWADAFLFTGKVAPDGDRDGFPNVLGEAMAHGLIVLSSAVAATPEVIRSGETGELLETTDPAEWLSRLRRLQTDAPYRERIRRNAHAWVEEHFDAHKNARTLLQLHKTFFTA